jgi:predicted ATPase
VRELPTGTVTLLFTDIEGSTKLLDELGAERYADVLDEHRRVLRNAFEQHGGIEIDTQGDAFFVASACATDAAAAARDAIAALGDGPVRVRIGVHTGEPIVREGSYVGADVHRAARVMSAAHGGQIVASQTTRDLLDGGARDLGVHRLKDVGELRLFQLGEESFPPLRSLNNTNLPAQLEPLLGRKRELADLLRHVRVDGARVVTLTGPGGIGKTRLALELAGELVPDFEHGVWLVDLSALRDHELVLGAIAGVLGARTSVEEHVSNRELLLVLDNFEQVVDAASDLSGLLESCPRLRVVVTSREPLRIAGEREYALRPLAEAPAVELFRQRVTTDATYHEVATLCRRLDNLPLAIELAAARAKALPFDELARRLERRLPTLGKGRRDAPERQRTLRATIDWSYELLTKEEQLGLAGLAVFRGGWLLEPAEEVADVGADLLDSLVDKSLVRREGARYSMLETIREYAAERLDERDDADDLRRRHAEWIVALGLEANMNAESDGEQRHDAVTAEVENVRAALDWARMRGETELEIRMLFALENWWITAGPTRQSLERAESLLGRLDGVPDRLQGDLLRVLGNVSIVLGDAQGFRRYEEALAHYRRSGDEPGTAAMLVRIAFNIRGQDVARARSLLDEARVLLDQVDVPRLELQATMLEALLACDAGDVDRGIALFSQVADSSERIGFVWQQEQALESVAIQLHGLGRIEEAEAAAREAVVLARRMGDWEDVAYLLALLASCAARTGDAERAARLWAAIEARNRREPLEVWRGIVDRFADDVDAGQPEHAPLDLDEAVAYALDLD